MTGSKEKQRESQQREQNSVLDLANAAKQAASALGKLSHAERNKALLAIADEIAANEEEILRANEQDVKEATKALAEGQISQALVDRLKLDKNKLASVVSGIRQIANMSDPLGKIDLHRELDRGLELERVTCPIGLIAVIFEARPDALPQIVALCLKSGDGIILKGGAEAERSNRALFDCVKRAVEKAGLPGDCLALLASRSDVNELLKADRYVDLIIPRGSNSLVRFIQDNTRIPVLGHADGICHVYIDESADAAKAVRITCDAKVQYPAACNAAETILVHEKIAPRLTSDLISALHELHVEVRCDERAMKFAEAQAALKPATEADWGTEYGDLIVSIKIVKNVDEAIDHINKYGSGHTETMVAEDEENFEKFFAQVNSAGVFLNASTRFADGFRYGFGAEVGISTAKQHPRGPVGIEGLVTYKYKLKGSGQVVGDYVGDRAKQFTHRDIEKQGNK